MENAVLEYLYDGRKALIDGDEKAASLMYMKVVNNSKDDDYKEAEVFALWTLVIDELEKGKCDEAGKYYTIMCSKLTKGIQSIASDLDNTRQFLGEKMVEFIEVATEKFITTLVSESKKGTLGSLSPNVYVKKLLIESLKPLGDEVLAAFGENEEYIKLALRLWKMVIYVRHAYCEYRNFQDKNKETWYDKIIKSIQKFDPTFTAPVFKQAGCIMAGAQAQEAAKVRPGE